MPKVLIKGSQEDLEPGGFVKNHQPNGPPHERPGKNKTPRHQRNVLEELSLVIVPEQAAPAAKPSEVRKEVKEVSEMGKDIAEVKTRQQYRICPICGQFAIEEESQNWFCMGCSDNRYKLYVKGITAQILAGEKPEALTKAGWTYRELDIARFERELVETREKKINPIAEMFRQAGAEDLPDVQEELRPEYQRQIDEEVRVRYSKVRRLNARLIAAKKLKLELEQMLIEKAAATAAPVAKPEPVNIS
ncbi:MAG: hypothetical protein ABIG29_01420 [Candidatus Nealsonbacteria bacterium]